MRIMTFNIQHALDYKKQIIDLDFFANAIYESGCDICCLNEVRGKGPIEGYTDQTNALAYRLGFQRYFGQAVKIGGTSPYGNAIISKYNFKSCETVAIPLTEDRNEKSNYEPRCVIKSVAEIDEKEICFLVCHMGLSNAERINAVETVCDLIDSTPRPIILCGDFNTHPQDKVLAPIYERLKDVDEKSESKGIFTYPSYKPEIKIDYIFYRDIECIQSEVIEKVFSDHYPIVADFKI